MQISERDNFAKMLLGLAELYGKTMSKTVMKFYWQALVVYPWQDVVEAMRLHTEDPDTGQFMPKPADIIRIIKGNSQSQSLQAWSKVERAIRQIGPYRSVVFDDVIIHAVMDEMGGWVKLCKVSHKELPFIAREFQIRYTAYKHQAPNHYPAKLIGLIEHQNLIQGHRAESVVLLGNAEKAKNVLSKGNEVSSSNILEKCLTEKPEEVPHV